MRKTGSVNKFDYFTSFIVARDCYTFTIMAEADVDHDCGGTCTSDVDSLHFSGIMDFSDVKLQLQSSKGNSPQHLKNGADYDSSSCMSLSDIEDEDDYLDWDSTHSSDEGGQRRPEANSEDAADGTDQDLDEDYRFAVELDRAINGDWERLERLLMNMEEAETQAPEEPEPLYPLGEGLYTECQICFEDKFLHKRVCCQYPVCDDCLKAYYEIQVGQANVKITCPHCKSYVYRIEVFDKVSDEVSKKFHQFIVDANKDPLQKTCPRCSGVHSIEEWQLKDKQVKKYGLAVSTYTSH